MTDNLESEDRKISIRISRRQRTRIEGRGGGGNGRVGKWFGSMGSSAVDSGNPVDDSSTVQSNGVVAGDGGANPASGYSPIEVSNLDKALEKAKNCPVLVGDGSVAVAEAMDR